MDHGDVSDKKYEIQPLMQSVQTKYVCKIHVPNCIINQNRRQ